MRLVLTFILLIHGLIHLIGFAKALRPSAVAQLTRPISTPEGALWLVASLSFTVAGILHAVKNDFWWLPAAAAIVLSQSLIVLNWRDAKFGTIPNIILLMAIIVGHAVWNFNSMVEKELSALLAGATSQNEVVTQQRISLLPEPVQNWLFRSNIIGKQIIRTVRLRQNGKLRTTPNGRWMRVEAQQFNTVENPGFLWWADVKMAPFLHLAGRDNFQNGKGHMLIKFLWLFAVTDAKGPAIDQGALVRYMAEIVWFPTAALADYISWKQADPTTAEATIRFAGMEATGVFEFTPRGDFKSFDAMRYYDREGGATLEKWHIDAEPAGFHEFQGIRVPARSAVTWKLKEGDFTWYKLKLTDIEYNL